MMYRHKILEIYNHKWCLKKEVRLMDFYFEIILYLHAVARHSTKKFNAFFTHFPIMLTFAVFY